MEHRETGVVISEEEIRALARIAGLELRTERVSLLRAELKSALAAARELDRVITVDSPQGGLPFDPAWDRAGRSA